MPLHCLFWFEGPCCSLLLFVYGRHLLFLFLPPPSSTIKWQLKWGWGSTNLLLSYASSLSFLTLGIPLFPSPLCLWTPSFVSILAPPTSTIKWQLKWGWGSTNLLLSYASSLSSLTWGTLRCSLLLLVYGRHLLFLFLPPPTSTIKWQLKWGWGSTNLLLSYASSLSSLTWGTPSFPSPLCLWTTSSASLIGPSSTGACCCSRLSLSSKTGRAARVKGHGVALLVGWVKYAYKST